MIYKLSDQLEGLFFFITFNDNQLEIKKCMGVKICQYMKPFNTN